MIELRDDDSRHPSSFSDDDRSKAPESVRLIRTLGHGRAAQAQLVEATMADGRQVTCVEKVFAPGLLTRLIYRLSFQAPFAYQSNEDAIRACFYRRRVAAAILASSDLGAEIAEPLYVRFDAQRHAWVLAARWVDGRGIRPAEPDPNRLSRWLRRLAGKLEEPVQESVAEIDQLVALMGKLELLLGQGGLVGSGWQVAPRAMVSTANLLRVDDRYTIIDLESGIPAVLVGRYLISGLGRGELPPFDDLDGPRLKEWLRENERLLIFRLGPRAFDQLRGDVESLITHTRRWKDSEWALFRRPWRHLTRPGINRYREECLRRWQQQRIIDPSTASTIERHPLKLRAIWWAGMLPSKLGQLCSKLIGNRNSRAKFRAWVRDPEFRRARWERLLREHQARWTAAGRLPESKPLTRRAFLLHGCLRQVTPVGLHRLLVDPVTRRDVAIKFLLLLFSARYQSWLGWQRVETAITRWQSSERISEEQAERLREDLCGHEVRAYTRGFAGHLALKTLAPVILPAKVGGVAAFAASGNLWFLLPLISTPVLRTAITLASAWSTRHRGIPHGEALATGWLPVGGSLAFPLQMFSSRPELSTFLIRDAASKLGRKLPVYGGADSRTEMAAIRATDGLIEVMETMARRLRNLFRRFHASVSDRTREPAVTSLARTRFGRWLDRKAAEQMERQSSDSSVEIPAEKHAA